MHEFIIRGEPEEDFGLHFSIWAEALRPANLKYEPVPGTDHLCILVEGHEISFSPEPPGWQVVFEDGVSGEWATRVAQDICENMARVSGQTGKIIPL